MQSGRGSSIAPGRQRLATETYWNLRRCALSVRHYLTQFYTGEKHGQRFDDLFLMAECVDIGTDAAYRRGGLPLLAYELATNDQLEHCLARIGGEVLLQRTGDYQAFQEVLTAAVPGRSNILPQWAVDHARDHSKLITAQRERVRRGGLGAEDRSDDEEPAARRRTRNRRDKDKKVKKDKADKPDKTDRRGDGKDKNKDANKNAQSSGGGGGSGKQG